METYSISEAMVRQKVEDYRANSSLIPGRGGLMAKGFAQSLGLSAGKTFSTYELMYSGIENGDSVEDVQKQVRRDIGQKSKVAFKVPLMKEQNARNCGLVSLNYAGFYDNEVELYAAIREDLQEYDGSTDILEATKNMAAANPDRYRSLLEKKAQTIDDFSILMGLDKNSERRAELGTEFPEHMNKYFNMVSKVHNGANFGISWPISIKKFAEPMREGLYHDSFAAAIQEGLREDFGFTSPEPSKYKSMLEEVKDTVQKIKDTKNPLAKKWKVATALPTSLFFLSGMDAYAHNYEEVHRHGYSMDEIMMASTTAGFSAFTTNEGEVDEDFTTTFACLFTTSL